MASFLGFKISVFLIGMLLAEAVFRVRNEETEQAAILMGLAGVICGLQDNRLLMVLYAGLVICLFVKSERSGVARALNRIFETKEFKFLGDISYPVYLTHQLILLPVCAVMARYAWVTGLSPAVRFLLSVGIIMPLVLCLSHLIHHYVEMLGIQAGKRVLRGQAQQTPAL